MIKYDHENVQSYKLLKSTEKNLKIVENKFKYLKEKAAHIW